VSLSILNNVAALYAQNSLTSNQFKLQGTLQQLSSGSRINSGADDPAGLAVADGLSGNQAALTQSTKNADSGIGLLQTSDGSLSQVTSLLNRATTLATEAANGTLSATQISSANQEYQSILAQIGHIGSATNFNSLQVFTNAVNDIVVTDGTSSGLSVYSDTIGVLGQASVGTTSATVILEGVIPGTTSKPAIVDTPAKVGVANTPGEYSLTAGNSTDTLAGTISFKVGGGAQQNIIVAAGSSLTTVAGQISGALGGLSTSVSNNVINITGPVTGADAAANTVDFTGTSITFSQIATSLAAGSYNTPPSIPGQPARVSMTLAGDTWDTRYNNSTSDKFSGTIILDQAGQTSKTITIVANSEVNPVTTVGSVEYQIAQQLQGSAYALAPDTGSWSDPVFNFTGADTSSPLTIDSSSTFKNNTTSTATATASAGTAGAAPGSAMHTYTLAALASSTDTFGSGAGNANSLDINGTNVSIAAMTAGAAKLAINAAFNSVGISASVSTDGTTLTILGNINGAALSVLGYNGAALALTDQALDDYPSATALGAGSGTPSVSPDETISTMTFGAGAKIGDPLTGSVTVQVGSGPAETLTLAANTTLDNDPVTGISTQLTADRLALGLVGYNGIQVNDVNGTPTLTAVGADDVSTTIIFTPGTVVDAAQSNYYSMNFVSDGTTDPDVPAQSTLTLGYSAVGDNPSVGDTISGSVEWGQNSNAGSVVLTAGTTLTDSTTDTHSITYQLNHDSDFQSAGLTASLSGTNIVLTATSGTLGSIDINPNGPLLDLTTASSSVQNDIHIGGPVVPPTYTTPALASSSDTFGSSRGNANTLYIDGVNISLAGLTANQAMLAINNNNALQEMGVSAQANDAGTQITVSNFYNGSDLLLGYNAGALALTDQSPAIGPNSSVVQTAAPRGSPAGSGTSVITMGHSTDTLSGTLNTVVNGQTAAVTVASGTTGLELQNQINLDPTFKAASLVAVYDSTLNTITITGPPGSTLDTTATLLTDTTAPTQTIAGTRPGAGADFTAASVSQLSSATATTVLTTITSAIADVAYQRGTLGADINQLTSACNVASAESVNLLSAQNSVLATDYGQAASNLSKYQILSQMGISALAQANSVQQEVLKLLQ
jgi:flagellin